MVNHDDNDHILIIIIVTCQCHLKLFELFLNADDRDGVEEVRRKARLSGAADHYDDYEMDQDHNRNIKDVCDYHDPKTI